jgi:lysophospholipase L1-like esterase
MLRRYQTIFFGANDACLPDSASGQHVPLETFKANLRAIVTHPAVLAQKAVVMLVSPPPLDEYLTEEHNTVEGEYTPQRTANHTKLYADACKDIASELNVTHIDLWRSMMIKAGWKEGDKLIPGSKELPRNSVLRDYLSDGESSNPQLRPNSYGYVGLHLNPAGYRVLFEETMRAIGEHHALQTPNEIPYHSPLWRDLPKYDSTRA